MKPIRVQLRRTKGWKMPENTISVARPGRYGNPFRIGGFFMVGDPDPKRAGEFALSWCESYAPDPRFTLIENAETAVAFFRKLMATGFWKHAKSELRGKNLACWCKIGEPCHADVLLEIAN